MEGSVQQYLEMYLSEQIPEAEWEQILKERADVRRAYEDYLENRANK